MRTTTLSLLFAGLLLPGSLWAQAKKTVAYYPNHQEMMASYERTRLLDSALKKLPTRANIRFNWQAGAPLCWYRLPLKNFEYEFYVADASKGTQKLAFDHKRMADALSKELGKPQEPYKLPITNITFLNNGNDIQLKAGDKWLQCNLQTYTMSPSNAPERREGEGRNGFARRSRYGFRADTISPDKQFTTLIKDGNIFLKYNDGKVKQLTTDGTTAQPYGRISWAPDSKHFVAYRIDPKVIKPVYTLLSAVEGTTRAQLNQHEYAQPGDDFTSYEMFVFNPADGSRVKAEVESINFFGPPLLTWRNNNNRYFTYERPERGHQRFRVIEVDAQTGKARHVIDEQTKTFIYEQRTYTHYLNQTNEILWTSEQDGWRHIYLVNGLTGKQKLVTAGNWVVRDIDSVDAKGRQIWFYASGINKGEDPYNKHYYRIGFDGKGLTDLTPETGTHTIAYSADRKYFTDTYSQVNVPPVSNLRATADGHKVMELSRGSADDFLAAGVKLPEVFVAKARDGKTDIWGVICRPSNFDPNKLYPIIENIYAGPHDSFVPKTFLPYSEMQSIAELGFIVVQIDGMGTANRSKAFHDVCWKNIADAGFPDRILWMKAMAAKYPQADTTRVGIYGTSAGGQNSMGALLFHPEFYKAAVSSCGCHDNRIDKQWWNEQWMGYPVGPHYGEQSNITNAAKLQGKLLLIVGDNDTNVPPESTYRLADALIKANKDFDFLSLPGVNHTDGGTYGRRKKRDFFVKHLLHADTPDRNTEGADKVK